MIVVSACFLNLEGKKSQPLSCDLSVTSQWVDLDPQRTQQFGEKWILAGELVFHKRTNELISIKEIDLAWIGESIKYLNASLFRKNSNNMLVPIDEALICDGKWNTQKQSLTLKFNEKEYLQPTTTFCLVLTVTNDNEASLKTGYFDIIPDNLPYQIKKSLNKKEVRISLAKAHLKSTTKEKKS
jgi:hypothetical protein